MKEAANNEQMLPTNVGIATASSMTMFRKCGERK